MIFWFLIEAILALLLMLLWACIGFLLLVWFVFRCAAWVVVETLRFVFRL